MTTQNRRDQTVNEALLPCPTCPWRVNRDATTIPNYNHQMACNLTNTVGEEDGFRPIMACHCSPEGNPHACNGYLAVQGWSNINVRLMLSLNEILNPNDVLEACEAAGIELEPDYHTVLNKMAASINADQEDESLGPAGPD